MKRLRIFQILFIGMILSCSVINCAKQYGIKQLTKQTKQLHIDESNTTDSDSEYTSSSDSESDPEVHYDHCDPILAKIFNHSPVTLSDVEYWPEFHEAYEGIYVRGEGYCIVKKSESDDSDCESTSDDDDSDSENESEDNYDSDSEDEDEYRYPGHPALVFPKRYAGHRCLVFYRGIHFERNTFSKKARSRFRRSNEARQPIFSSGAFELANAKPTDENLNRKIRRLKRHGRIIKNHISAMKRLKRRVLQQKYTNQYDQFIRSIQSNKKLPSNRNPQVSTGEEIRHPLKYGCGLKFLGVDARKLKPEYNVNGKPKHPYLGKMYIIIAKTDDLPALDPYFVVHGHAQGYIKISTHFANDILTEREVSFPGFIPGKHVALSMAVRVPSFEGPYKDFYQQKFGITERSYKITQTKIKNGTAKINRLIDRIINHTSETLVKHVRKTCKKHNIRLVFKDLNDGFANQLPDIKAAKQMAKQH